ncbi:hypothetical protein Q8F55_007593 [Vanrija albida]|uniref:Uncharacterized protein n=1 Tax=Vanrija albida TaxID=181172 RepID=A0ABR3PTZ3_9TREE
MSENTNPYAPAPLQAARRVPASPSPSAPASSSPSAPGPSRQAAPLREWTSPERQQQGPSSTRPSTPPPRRSAPPLPPSPPSARRAAAPPPERRPTQAAKPARGSPARRLQLDDEVFGVRAVEFWHPTTAAVADAYARDESPPRKVRAGRRERDGRDGSLRC